MIKIVQITQKGTTHKKKGMPCQDRVLTVKENGVQFLGLADGAGSKKKSHLGAEIILYKMSVLFTERFDELFALDLNLMQIELIKTIYETLASTSKKRQCDVRDLASTLEVVAMKDERMIVAHLGDGVIGYHTSDGWEILSKPENGEFINVTYFTTSTNLEKHLRVQRGTFDEFKAFNGIFMASDGGECLCCSSKDSSFLPESEEIFALVFDESEEFAYSELQNFYRSNLCNRITGDDCSAIIWVDTDKTLTENTELEALGLTGCVCKSLYNTLGEQEFLNSGKILESYRLLRELGDPAELMLVLDGVIKKYQGDNNTEEESLNEDFSNVEEESLNEDFSNVEEDADMLSGIQITEEESPEEVITEEESPGEVITSVEDSIEYEPVFIIEESFLLMDSDDACMLAGSMRKLYSSF